MFKGFKLSFLVLFLFLAFTLSGCVIRTYTQVKPRVDQEIAGNQGYLAGQAKPAQLVERKKERQIQVFEIELRNPIQRVPAPATKPEPEPKSADQELSGNLGYVEKTPQQVEVYAQPKTKPQVTTYTVQKGDTLEKIAAKKEIYSDFRKWKKIYEANQGKIKNPRLIYPGQVLVIPAE